MSHLFLLAAVYNGLAALILWMNTPQAIEADRSWPVMGLRHWSSRFFVGAGLFIFSVIYLYCFSLSFISNQLIVAIMALKLFAIVAFIAEAKYQQQPLEDFVPILLVNSLFLTMFLIGHI